MGGASDFVTDFFGGNSGQNKKKKPNETIRIDRKNEEKLEKKSESVKKTSKNSNNKIESETTEKEPDSLLDAFQETIDELSSDGDEEQATEINSSEDFESLKEYDEYNDYVDNSKKDDDNKVEIGDDTRNRTEHVAKKPTKTKKNKKASSYGFDFLARFFSFFNGN